MPLAGPVAVRHARQEKAEPPLPDAAAAQKERSADWQLEENVRLNEEFADAPELHLSSADLEDLGPRVRAVSGESWASTGSQANFAKPEETLLIFDWDDTICPSFWVKYMQCASYDSLGPERQDLKDALDEIAAKAEELLTSAKAYGKVVIVTNAETGWIELSCKRWLPSLQPVVQEIECLSARSTWEPSGLKSPFQWKAREFEDVIDKFYSKRLHQSWKNVVSIGDSPHERQALQQATLGSVCRKKMRCRTKTIKLKVRPQASELIQELVTLTANLEQLVCHDDSLDIVLLSTDNA
jgi:hypothetical protein